MRTKRGGVVHAMNLCTAGITWPQNIARGEEEHEYVKSGHSDNRKQNRGAGDSGGRVGQRWEGWRSSPRLHRASIHLCWLNESYTVGGWEVCTNTPQKKTKKKTRTALVIVPQKQICLPTRQQVNNEIIGDGVSNIKNSNNLLPH